MKTHITIRLSESPTERKEAIAYIREHMFKTHGSYPPSEHVPQDIFIAREGSEIVGALCIEFGTKDAPLPFESFFDFDRAHLPIPYGREKTIYYSRWNSSREGIGQVLWLVASKYALDRGAIFSSATGKENMRDYYREKLKCQWHPIEDAFIRRSAVGESERSYFFGASTPAPWLGIIAEQIAYLPDIVKPLYDRYTFSIEI